MEFHPNEELIKILQPTTTPEYLASRLKLLKAVFETTFSKNAEGYGYKYLRLDRLYELALPVLYDNGFQLMHFNLPLTVSSISQDTESAIELVPFDKYKKTPAQYLVDSAGQVQTITSHTDYKGVQYGVFTRILNEYGHHTTFLPASTAEDSQIRGSDNTYSQRYNTLALLNIAPTDDDDGHQSSKSGQKRSKQQQSSGDAW